MHTKTINGISFQYTKEFTNSEVLSRKLAYQCAKKITILVNETDAICHPNTNPAGNAATNSGNSQPENQSSNSTTLLTGSDILVPQVEFSL